jgi:hypothetical protein
MMTTPQRPDQDSPQVTGTPPVKKSHRGWKVAGLIALGFFVLGVVGVIAAPKDSTPTTAAAPAVTAPAVTATQAPTQEPTQAPEPAYTVSQENAIESAESYLDYSSFSESGLIDQLKYEGFSKADASFAVNHIQVDWSDQAAKSAKDYLKYSSFSRSGLIDQLKYEGFSTKQATYGVNQTGL